MPWKILSKKEVSHNQRERTEDWQVQVSSGAIKSFSISIGRDVVVVFGIPRDQRVLMIREYFVALERTVWSIVAGVVDGGSHKEAAEKELREETGCAAGELVYLGATQMGKYRVNFAHFYLAKDVESVGPQELESGEEIEVVFVSLDEFLKLLRAGEVQDGLRVAGAYRALDYLNLLSHE